MIFSKEHIAKILKGEKTQTRRASPRYKVNRFYAIQPSRTSPAISDGKIFVKRKRSEYKSKQLTRDDPLRNRLISAVSGYPISQCDAFAEGGYTVKEYETLYEKLNPGWSIRFVYTFDFYTAEQIANFQKEPVT